MPRARREQDYPSRSKASRGGLSRTTPPRLQEVTTNTLQSQRFDSVNNSSTATTENNESLTPFRAGLTSGLQSNTFDGSDFTNTTLQNSTLSASAEQATSSSPITLVHNANTNTLLTDNAGAQATNSFSINATPMSSLVNSVASESDIDQSTLVNNSSCKVQGLSALLAQWTKKNDGIHVAEVSMSAPSWMQNYEKYGLTKAAAAIQVLTDGDQSGQDDKTKNLRDELRREKASRVVLEQLYEEQRSQCNTKQQELEETQREKEEIQRRLETAQRRVTELESTLAAAQRALEAHHNSTGTNDWVLERQEIELTEKIIGIGGWGKVVEGRFRGMIVAVKQIHELILSPHNRRLFEREMNIAARCRHPCLLQFIGATNDDDSPLFVSELLDTSLRKVLQDRELKGHEVRDISLDVARALNYLHLNRPTPIIHRDISSANVLLWRHGEGWRAKVSDYGTANFMQYSMTISPGALVYSAPEAQTSRQSPKVDVYSFGVLLCEMLTREFPDPMCRTEQVAMVTDHILRDLIRRCLLVEPPERPSINNIINELENMSLGK